MVDGSYAYHHYMQDGFNDDVSSLTSHHHHHHPYHLLFLLTHSHIEMGVCISVAADAVVMV